MKKWIEERFKITGLAGCAMWFVFIFFLAVSDVGRVLPEQSVQWYDAIWIPIVVALFPMAMGFMAKK